VHPEQPPARVIPSAKRLRYSLLILFAVVALCVCGLVATVAVLRSRVPEPTRSPSASDRVVATVRGALEKQRAALLAGDEAGYLAVLDADAEQASRASIRQQFRSLVAMKVVEWRDQVMTATDELDGRWAIDVASSPCFVTAPCADAHALSSERWRVLGETATMISWQPGRQPHPWQVSELISSSGNRTIVATTKDQERKLANLLKEAEKAALVADRFARQEPPSRYVIYYAGREEWRRWFAWNPPDWSAGVAVDVSADRYEVVLNAGQMNADSLPAHLRHEMTHASSLPGKFRDTDELWWLKEGIAELAEANGAPIRDHPGLGGASAALAASTTGFEIKPPADEEKDVVVGGAYAVAFLGARCLSERFGEKKFVEFFHAVLHDGKSEAVASSDVFGADWVVITRDCLDYAHAAIR
jgi:hypothetical protein